MGDLGIFKVTAEVDSSGKNLPNVIRNPVTQAMDVTAKDMKQIVSKDPFKAPNGIEYLEDTETFATIIPAKRFVPVGNVVDKTSSTTKLPNPYVKWQVVPGKLTSGVVGGPIGSIINLSETAKNLETKLPGADQDSSYKGPRWITSAYKKEIPDGNIGSSLTAAPVPIVVKGVDVDDTKINWAEQTVSEPDICWAVQTTSINTGGEDNLPFWISFLPKQPNSKDLPAFFAIRINPGGGGQHDGSFDIVFQENQPPSIYDWNKAESTSGNFSPLKADLHLVSGRSPNKSGIVWGQENRIGILPIGGKLHICIKEGDRNYVYNRLGPVSSSSGGGEPSNGDNQAEFVAKNFKIKLSSVMLVGGSCSAAVNASAMAFDKGECGTGQLGAASKDKPDSFSNSYSGSRDGVKASSGAGININPLEKKPEGARVGVRAKFNDIGAPNDSDSTMGKSQGQVKTSMVDSPANAGSKEYRLTMVADDAKFGEGAQGGSNTMTAVLPPVVHRLRGVYPETGEAEGEGMSNISDDLMSFADSFSTSDNAIVDHSLNLVIYNEGGIHDDFLNKAMAVRVSAGWGDPGTPFFTGVAMGGARSEVAGKETLDITCQDYMYVLASTPMVNSPYYDGMDVFAVISDLASRAGIKAVDDTNATIRQFVGGGYSLSEPVWRFGSKTNIKENIAAVATQYSLVVYFNGYGVMHVADLTGGIQFPNDPGSVEAEVEFYKNPDKDDQYVIIGEKRKESRLKDVCTQIFIKSVDASLSTLNEGQFIFGVKKADQPILPFEKTFMLDNPAYGSESNVKAAVDMLAQRFFKPATGISIRTVGTAIVRPMSFIRVDGEVYRVDKATRTYNAEENSFIADYSGEWRGGQ